MRTSRTSHAVVALALLIAACVTGCTSQPDRPSPIERVPDARLDASVAQFRFDEGTRNLRAGVTNNSDRDIRVTSATIVWDGFAFPEVPITDDLVKPGLTAAFQIAYGAPRCTSGRRTRSGTRRSGRA